ncbi:MAG TPA: trimethylamine methyltransferase family protein, partial [Acidobacteriota bacterium]|nr:trimethylamine methyltransferase family protein [Acidobacteriota bacterium]
MRPHVRFLSDELLQRILDEARDLLAAVGVEIHNPAVVDLLHAGGARVEAATGRVHIPGNLVDRALATAPAAFRLYDATGEATHAFGSGEVTFTPGSSAIYILDEATRAVRHPVTADYVRYAKLVSRLPHIASQSTAMIAADVHAQIGDSYRLYLSLLYCEKPVITGAFSAEGFPVMRDLLVAARGSAESLRERPLAVFSCCPTAPLKWSGATSQNVVDCARAGIPVEYVSMPLAGFMAPVTLTGSLVQHTAETLSGIVISQLAAPGAPALYGGSPAIFDVRYETTPMGAIETMMMDCAYSEIGHRLGLPTQGYIGLSDAKLLDAQAGWETGIGATLAALLDLAKPHGIAVHPRAVAELDAAAEGGVHQGVVARVRPAPTLDERDL